MAQWALESTSHSPFRWRGVIEGFYGTPYTHAARLDLLEFMGRQGYNIYIYAPKQDPLHRDSWRQMYGPKAMSSFDELVRAGQRHGVDISAAISPGLSFRYSSEADFKLLEAKMRQFAGVGVHSFGLFFDDIPAELANMDDRRAFGTLAAAQAALAERLLECLVDIPGRTLWFCPTQYCGSPETPYLRELGRLLPAGVEAFWTGPAVCSHRIEALHLRRVADVLGRPPVVWDNYPVNDALMVGELHIGPYEGRDGALAGVAAGFCLNPMNQLEASKIALATAAEYLADPLSYRPGEAWSRALGRICGGHDDGTLGDFAAANTVSPLAPGDPPGLELTLEEARARFAAMDYGGAMASFDQLFERMDIVLRGVRNLPNRALAAEIRPWVDEYGFWIRMGRTAIRAYRLMLRAAEARTSLGRARAFLQLETQLERIRLGLRRSLDLHTTVCGQTMASLAREVYRQIRGVLSQQAPLGPVSARLIGLYRTAGVRLKPYRND